jgi:hypothetical protein
VTEQFFLHAAGFPPSFAAEPDDVKGIEDCDRVWSEY